MKNKCPNCGYNYGEFDIFCSRCGCRITKLEAASSDNNEENIANKVNASIKNEFFYKKTSKDSNLFDFFIILFFLCVALTVMLIMIFHKQSDTREYLQYKNYTVNPSRIPLLVEPNSLREFSKNLADNEEFLKLYLKYSKDPIEKKEQTFILYLTEMNKLRHISNEDLEDAAYPECTIIKSDKVAARCAKKYNKRLKNTGALAYLDRNKIFLYPNTKYIERKYSKFLSDEMKSYLKLQSGYNFPICYEHDLLVEPKIVAKKIKDFEILYNNIYDDYIKEDIQRILYESVKIFIFAHDIYATTTHEMQKEYKYAYNYFIAKNRYSAFKPMILSYINEQKNYTSLNFKADYPYTIRESNFDEAVENSSFKDIYAHLRKNIVTNSLGSNIGFVYDFINGKWRKYSQDSTVTQHDYMISYPDENNNVFFYNSSYSPIQELNVGKYSSLFVNNANLYTYNEDKLSINRIIYNGKTFNTKTVNFGEISSLYPGIEVINLDTNSNYDIYIEKPNRKATYIILSRYMQGFNGYKLTPLEGDIDQNTLSNMFSVNSVDEVVISFHNVAVNPDETSESTPTYKLHIATIGYKKSQKQTKSEFVQYDEQTKQNADDDDELYEEHTPNIKPKIDLTLPPSRKLEPPVDDDD